MVHNDNDYTYYIDDDCLKRTRMCLLQKCAQSTCLPLSVIMTILVLLYK